MIIHFVYPCSFSLNNTPASPSIETSYSNPESQRIVSLSKYIEYKPLSPWFSPNCFWKRLSLSDLVTAKLSQNRSCPELPATHQFSHRASRKVRRPCFEASETRLSETKTENFFDRLPKIKLQTFSSITQSKAVEDSGNKVILKADLFDCSDKTFEKVLQ